jgi:hypothetical protein
MLFVAAGLGSCNKESKKAVLEKVAVTEDEAEIKFDTLSHDFGNVLIDTLTSYDFVFHNIGATTLHIETVIPSCGCTDVDWPRGGIEPGDPAVITVTYNSHGRNPGHFQKTIRVYSDGKTRFQRLNISGEMVENTDGK